jgi:condensin-2 complex subunit G2
VKRCHALRGALELFDFDDASIESLKQLLLRAAFAPAFLRAAEGRRFLSALFALHAGLTRELYAILRNQIPTGARANGRPARSRARACCPMCPPGRFAR